MCMRLLRSLLLVFLLTGLVLIPSLLLGQSQANTGTIEGTVVDPSGSAIPNAEVTLKNLGTNFTRVIQTDTDGRFRGLLLPLGPYTVTAKAPHFGTIVRQALDLAVGQSISLNLTLNISQIGEVMSANPDAPLLETGVVDSSTNLDERHGLSLANYRG